MNKLVDNIKARLDEEKLIAEICSTEQTIEFWRGRLILWKERLDRARTRNAYESSENGIAHAEKCLRESIARLKGLQNA